MVKISANPFHPRSRETEWSDPMRRDAQMERVHVRGDAHRKNTVSKYRMDGIYDIEMGKSMFFLLKWLVLNSRSSTVKN